MSFKVEVQVGGEWSTNGVAWPDKASAETAGKDLLMRWFVPTACRAVEVEDAPNRPTWDEWVGKHGLPPKRVSVEGRSK